MWDSDSDESDSDSFPLKQGMKKNVNGGFYEQGKQYDLSKKFVLLNCTFCEVRTKVEVDLTYLS